MTTAIHLIQQELRATNAALQAVENRIAHLQQRERKGPVKKA